MALQKQIIPVSFAQGLDTKTDPKQVIAGKMLLLQNCVFINPLRYTKRNGYDRLGRAGTVGSALTSYLDECLAFDGLTVRSLSQSIGSFIDKGQAISVEVGMTPVISNGYTQSSMDGCYHSYGIKAFAWEDSRGGMRYSVLDSTTSQVMVADQVLAATGVRPKVFALGNFVVFVYFDGTNLAYKRFAVNDPTTLSSAVDLATDVDATDPYYDAKVIGSRLFFAYNTSAVSGSVAVAYLSSTLTLSSAYEEASEEASVCIAIFGDANENVWVTYYDGTDVRAFVVSYELLSVATAVAVATVADVRNITGIMTTDTSATAGTATLLYERSATLDYNYFVTSCTLARSSGTLTPGTPAVFIRSVGLATKLFNYDGNFLVGLAYESELQPTYFFASLDGLIIAKVIALNAGGLTAKSVLPEVSFISDSIVQVALGKKGNLEVESGKLYSSTGVVSTELSFLSQNTYLRATSARNLHITGGFISMYDGVSVVEHGFHLFPEASTITTATTAGGIQAGTYQYSVVYEWKDNQGQTHQSAPSTPQTIVVGTGGTLNFTADTTNGSVTLTNVSSLANLFVGQLITGAGIPASTYITAFPSGTSITMSNSATATAAGITVSTIYTNKNTLAIPTLRVTAKQDTRAPVVLAVYRTQANSTVFYRVSSISSPTVNSTTADTVTFNDTTPDLYLSANELLYTTGGIIENIPAPACALITNYKSRLVVIPSETENEYWISKQVIAGDPVAFTDSFVKQVNPYDGKITAAAEMDDKLILFKKNSAMFTAGDGPNDTGQQDDLATPQLITTDAGCSEARSVVITPRGLMFKSTKGIYLLDRSLQVSYIGADVEEFNDLAITSAQLIPNTNQVRFTTADGTALVYDYLFNQWSVFTNHYVVDSTVFGERFTYLDPDGYVYQETPGEFLDGEQPIRIGVKTSWLQFGGLQGFQRVYQAMILGEYNSLHKLIVTVAYDFDPNPTQQTYINAGALLQPAVYGASSPYGEEETYGGDFPLYQFRLDLDRQKCQAVQIGLEEVPLVEYGEGLSLSGLTFLAGIKQGLYKIPAARQVA